MLPQLTRYPTYAGRFAKWCQQKTQFVILDNGAAEAHRGSWTDLVNTAHRYEVDEVAIPDVLGDSKTTFDQAVSFLYLYGQRFKNSGIRLGVVAQGKNAKEATETAFRVLDHSELVTTVYIPRLLLSESGHQYERITVATNINDAVDRPVSIHMFGMNADYPMELRQIAEEAPFVRGVDTSMPYNYTFKGLALWEEAIHHGQGPRHRVSRPDDYFFLRKEDFDSKLLKANISTFMDWAVKHYD